jgi:predicted nucleic acid-binding protein
MTHYYADSSALVKRHVVETGSAWLAALADPSAQVVSDILISSASPACVFLTADDRLLNLAIAEGMSVDNPNNHP